MAALWWALQQPALYGRVKSYAERVKALFGDALLAYWPLSEASGTTAEDVSGHGRHGVYEGVSAPAQVIGPTGLPAPYFDGTAGGVNAYSGSLAAAFNGREGALMCWARLAEGDWLNDTQRNLFYFRVDAANLVNVSKHAHDTLRPLYTAGGSSAGQLDFLRRDCWFHVCVGWSDSGDKTQMWINGAPRLASSPAGTWAGGSLASYYVRIGSLNGTSNLWHGWIQDVICLGRFPGEGEVRRVVSLAPRGGIKRIGLLGDSIPAPGVSYDTRWSWYVENQYNGGAAALYNHAVSGNSIMGQLALQVAAAAGDDADLILLALGTNDNDAGDMQALQAAVEGGIEALRASNPRAELRYLNVLPRFDGQAKDGVRAAIAAACQAKGVICWDPVSDPWIEEADTTDGVHLNASGAEKVAAQVLARL